MSGVEAAIIAAIARLAAPFLLTAIKKIEEKLKKRKVSASDIAILRTQLRYIQGVILEARKIIRRENNPPGRVSSSKISNWARTLSCLAYDIEDLIEGYEKETMTGAKTNEKNKGIQGSIEFIKSCPEFFTPGEGSHQTGASSSTSSPQIIRLNPQTGKNFPLADLVGKKEDLCELLGLVGRPNPHLGTGDPDPNKLKVMVISVIGFDGVGETKLCHYVFQDVQMNSKFSLYAPVNAAGKNGNVVLEEIIQRFHEQDPTIGLWQRIERYSNKVRQTIGWDPNDQVHQLSRYLQGKRYFIIVDNVESEELVKFIASVFPDNNKGSRIIMGMTTVVSQNAERCDRHMSKMRPLQDEQSVTWFLNEAEQRSTFSEFQEQGHSPSCFQKICDGVPLALVSVCEVRGGSTSAAAVKKACSELRSVEKGRWPAVMKKVVLPHSYDSLDIRRCDSQYIPYLQACLLYFAMFPRGNVKRGSLIRRWQAEGLEFGNSNQAEENLKTLVGRSFVWPLHVSTNEHQDAKAYQPPGVVLDYISDMSKTEEFILKSCPRHSRRLCLHPSGSEPLVITKRSEPPRLRTLAVSLGDQDARMIAECEQLRVLDLESYKGLQPTHLDKICQKLRLLKYLSLLPDVITELPKSVSNLKCLETLELGEGKAAVLVPIEVISLPCIKHLIGKFELKDSKIPNRLMEKVPWVQVPEAIKESKLERLAGFITRRGQGFPPLMIHMKHLRKVKIWFYKDADAGCVEDYLPDAITKFLNNDKGPHSLSLDFQDCPSSSKLLVASLGKASGELYSLKLSGDSLSKIDFFANDNTNQNEAKVNKTKLNKTNQNEAKVTGITKLCLCLKNITLDANFLKDLSKLDHLEYLKLDAETIKADQDNILKIVIETTHIINLKRMCLVAKQTLADIEIKPTALQNLVSLHLISGDNDFFPSANMICTAEGQVGATLRSLKEVALNAKVLEDSSSRNSWRDAARKHPNKPNILFIEHPHHAG